MRTIHSMTGAVDGMMVSARVWPEPPTWMREFIESLRAEAPAWEE